MSHLNERIIKNKLGLLNLAAELGNISRACKVNGICERFHKTILQEFYQVAFRRKLYLTLKELQDDLDEWLHYYNHQRTHQGKICCGRTPIETLIAGKEIWNEKVDKLNSI